MSELCKKALAGDFAGATAMQSRYLDVMNSMFADVNPIPVKEAMNQIGLNVGEYRMPLFPADSRVKQQIHDALQQAELL
jgi:4-hydroxy-tetrahydrodipicolinate synthase